MKHESSTLGWAICFFYLISLVIGGGMRGHGGAELIRAIQGVTVRERSSSMCMLASLWGWYFVGRVLSGWVSTTGFALAHTR